MQNSDWHLVEIDNLREKIKYKTKLKNQMIILCATGFATVISFSNKLPPLTIPLILFILIFITENIYYNPKKELLFLNEYLIQYSNH